MPFLWPAAGPEALAGWGSNVYVAAPAGRARCRTIRLVRPWFPSHYRSKDSDVSWFVSCADHPHEGRQGGRAGVPQIRQLADFREAAMGLYRSARPARAPPSRPRNTSAWSRSAWPKRRAGCRSSPEPARTARPRRSSIPSTPSRPGPMRRLLSFPITTSRRRMASMPISRPLPMRSISRSSSTTCRAGRWPTSRSRRWPGCRMTARTSSAPRTPPPT